MLKALIALFLLLFFPPHEHPAPTRTMPTAHVIAPNTAVGRNYIFATVPVPDDWDEGPLHLKDTSNDVWPTQVLTMTRGPADVTRTVQLWSAVDGPGGTQIYSVEEGSEPSAEAFPAQIEVSLGLNDHAAVAFSADLLTQDPAFIVAGSVMHEKRVGGVLVDGGGNRHVGYEAFFRTFAGEQDVILCDMTIQNGTVGVTPILHHVFFDSLELTVPAGWEVMHYRNDNFTDGATLIEPMWDETFHIMPQGGLHEFRIAIYQTGEEAKARDLLDRRGFAVVKTDRSYWSWSNPYTAWYLAQSVMVPDVSLQLAYNPFGATGAAMELAMATGLALPSALMEGGLGYLNPRHPTYSGYGSGVEITPWPGLEVISYVNRGQVGASKAVDSLRALYATQSMHADRSAGSNYGGPLMGIALCEEDQTPIDPTDYDLSGVSGIQLGQFNVNNYGPFPRPPADDSALDAVIAAGKLPWYYGDLMEYLAPPFSHQIRLLAPSLALAFLTNDPLAKSRIATYAAWDRMYLYESDNGALAAALTDAGTFPGKGGLGDRVAAWCQIVVITDWLFADDTKRTNLETWLEDCEELRVVAQLPSGYWMAESYGKPSEFISNQCGVHVTASQAMEVGIDSNAVRALEMATGGADMLAAFTYRRMAQGCWNYHWLPSQAAPARISPVRYPDKSLAAFAVPADAPANSFTTDGDNFFTAPTALYGLMWNPNLPAAWQIIYAMTGTTTPYDAMVALETQIESATNTEDLLKFHAGRGPLLAFLQNYLLPASASDPTIGATPPVATSPPEDIITRIRAALAGLSPGDQATMIARIRTFFDRYIP